MIIKKYKDLALKKSELSLKSSHDTILEKHLTINDIDLVTIVISSGFTEFS